MSMKAATDDETTRSRFRIIENPNRMFRYYIQYKRYGIWWTYERTNYVCSAKNYWIQMLEAKNQKWPQVIKEK